jgi:hypothetical protein
MRPSGLAQPERTQSELSANSPAEYDTKASAFLKTLTVVDAEWCTDGILFSVASAPGWEAELPVSPYIRMHLVAFDSQAHSSPNHGGTRRQLVHKVVGIPTFLF